MKKEEITLNRRIGLIAVAALAAMAMIVAVTTILTMPLRDPIYLMGPGLYPFGLSILLLIACGAVFLEIRSGRYDNIDVRGLIDRAALKKPVRLLTLLAASLIALPILGYLVSIFLFSFIELTFMEKEKRKWWINAIFALAVTGGVYALFNALGMTLPEPFWI